MRLILSLGLLHCLLMLTVYYYSTQFPIVVSLLLITSLLATFMLLKKQYQRHQIILQSLDHGLQSLRDNDFSVSLNEQKETSYNLLINAFNQTSVNLREERQWTSLVKSLTPEFQHALNHHGESIFTLTDKQGAQQAWHVTNSSVTIHQARHQLFLLKTITQELSKQEAAICKK